jgi:hypothetical protein
MQLERRENEEVLRRLRRIDHAIDTLEAICLEILKNQAPRATYHPPTAIVVTPGAQKQ